MHIDYLIRMANDIGNFFASDPDPTAAAASIHNHIRRFWDPRMRAQIVAHYQETRGAGLQAAALNAVQLLAAETQQRTNG